MRFRLGKKKVELLAPAGNYESFLGAVHAGADAVYLGGEKFGARAYADNFTKQEICSAIRYAHVYGRKVYLTVNTLVKEREFQDVYTYLLPFYDAGLDGVIIQDLGVIRAVERCQHTDDCHRRLRSRLFKRNRRSKARARKGTLFAGNKRHKEKCRYRSGNLYSWGNLLLLFRSVPV